MSQNRYLGALLGLAIGDAVGTTVEFCEAGTFAPVVDMVGGGPFGLKPGQWTDDTSMALCLAESLIECDSFNAIDQLTRYVRWWREGHLSSTGRCFDIGNTTRQSLSAFERSGEPYGASDHELSAGNGSLMRLVAVPMFFSESPEQAIHFAGESSRTTHAAGAAIDACRFYAGLIVGALHGVSKAELLTPYYAPVAGFWAKQSLNRAVAEVAAGSYLSRQPPQIRGSGYVVHALEAALWAFANSDNFRDGCLLAVNLGDDADTTAAIYGQLAGAYYGAGTIPESWRTQVAMKETISSLAMTLHARRR